MPTGLATEEGKKDHSHALPSTSLDMHIKKRDDYVIDLEQFRDLIQQMEDHVATLTQKKKERQQELEETNRLLTRATAHIDQLKDTIKNQQLSPEDLLKMQNELKGVDEAIERALKLKDARRKALWDSENEVESLWNDLELAVSDYNNELAELSLLPLVSAKGIDKKAVINKAAIIEKEQARLLGTDLQGIVQPALVLCKQAYSEQLSAAKMKYQETMDYLEQSEDALSEAIERLKIMQDKLAKCDESLNAEKEAQEAKLAVRIREAEALEAKVASIRDPVALEEQMARYARQCGELEALRAKHQEENVLRKTAVCDEIEGACNAIQEYEDFCEQKIVEVEKYRRDKQASYGELKLPANRNIN